MRKHLAITAQEEMNSLNKVTAGLKDLITITTKTDITIGTKVVTATEVVIKTVIKVDAKDKVVTTIEAKVDTTIATKAGMAIEVVIKIVIKADTKDKVVTTIEAKVDTTTKETIKTDVRVDLTETTISTDVHNKEKLLNNYLLARNN